NRQLAAFDREWWPYVETDFARARSAFVYPTAAAFREAHAGSSKLFGVEFVDDDQGLDLTGVRALEGPGTLGVKTRLVVGPLARQGEQPITLVAGAGLSASGEIQASLIAPSESGNATFSGAQIAGTVTLHHHEPAGAGSFRVLPDPGLGRLDMVDRSEGLVVNVSPAPTAVFGRR
ncbi:MAG: hypothetical protein HY815_26925, partial [Candidatus Riflebacteria bacterium]|nr:hypothetical protein [Candidatus Riflebacteria bacterium]